MVNKLSTLLIRLTLLSLLAVLSLTGCGTDRVGSSVDTSSSESLDGSAPLFLSGFDGMGGDSASGKGGNGGGKGKDTSGTDDGSTSDGGSDDSASGNSPMGKVSSSAEVDGSVGGTVAAGRFSVYFPPGAFPGTETITVTEKAGAIVECKLEPHGLIFTVPVSLTVDLEYTTGDDGRTEIFWFDESTRYWVNLAGDYSAGDHSVTTELEHFSRYRPGRAGW